MNLSTIDPVLVELAEMAYPTDPEFVKLWKEKNRAWAALDHIEAASGINSEAYREAEDAAKYASGQVNLALHDRSASC